jgi:hypothetical protein
MADEMAPITVTPIWTVARSLSGSAWSFNNFFARRPPFSARFLTNDFREVTIAISDAEKKPFRIRKIRINSISGHELAKDIIHDLPYNNINFISCDAYACCPLSVI